MEDAVYEYTVSLAILYFRMGFSLMPSLETRSTSSSKPVPHLVHPLILCLFAKTPRPLWTKHSTATYDSGLRSPLTLISMIWLARLMVWQQKRRGAVGVETLLTMKIRIPISKLLMAHEYLGKSLSRLDRRLDDYGRL